jgi:hypothetical protein
VNSEKYIGLDAVMDSDLSSLRCTSRTESFRLSEPLPISVPIEIREFG